MPICITCSTPVKNLYTTYSKADDRALGKGVRLTQCPNCKRFADKYVEHDFVVLFIDLVLIKPQVYRHLLFNRLGRSDDKLDPSILRLGTLLLLFDVYITWARVEKSISAHPSDPGPHASLTNAPILLQYLFFLTLNFLATAAHHGTVRLLVRLFFSGTALESRSTSSDSDVANHDRPADGVPIPAAQFRPARARAVGPGRASPSAISTALLVSSCTKLFPILLVIWPEMTTKPAPDTGGPAPSFASRARSYVGWAVLLNNIEALLILLDCGYAPAISLALAGTTARWAVEGAILALAGLEGDRGPIGDMLVGLGRVMNLLPRR